MLRPSKSEKNKVEIVYTGRELPRTKRRLYQDLSSSTGTHTTPWVAGIRYRTSSLSSDGLPLIKRRRRCSLPPTPLHRDHVVEDSIAQAFQPPTQDFRKKAEFWQNQARKHKQQILNLETDARQLRRRLWELEEQVVWLASVSNNDDNGTGQGQQQPLSSTSTAQPVSPSTHHTERPPSYIFMQPRKCYFYLTDGEGLSEDEYDAVDDETCRQCCHDEETEEDTKESASSGGGNDGAKLLLRTKEETRDDEVEA